MSKNRFKKVFSRLFILIASAVLVYHLWILARVLWLVKFNPESSAFMENSLEEMQEKNPTATLKHVWIPYEKISPNIKKAVIAAEDAKFLSHEGFDWDAIQNAFEKNLKKGRIVAGGSTISQQLAKNLFLSKSRNPLRKIEEAVITFMIEKLMSKRRILEIYLNVIEWGRGIFGVEAASQAYFRCSSSQISSVQAAMLAAIIPNPVYFQTRLGSDRVKRKTGILLSRMRSASPPS